jgi:hypothetical protein
VSVPTYSLFTVTHPVYRRQLKIRVGESSPTKKFRIYVPRTAAELHCNPPAENRTVSQVSITSSSSLPPSIFTSSSSGIISSNTTSWRRRYDDEQDDPQPSSSLLSTTLSPELQTDSQQPESHSWMGGITASSEPTYNRNLPLFTSYDGLDHFAMSGDAGRSSWGADEQGAQDGGGSSSLSAWGMQ